MSAPRSLLFLLPAAAFLVVVSPQGEAPPRRKDGLNPGAPRRVRTENDIFVGEGGKKKLECDYDGELAPRVSGAIIWTFNPTTEGESAGTIVRGWDPLRMRGRQSVGDPSAPKTNEQIENERRQQYFPAIKPKYDKFSESHVLLIQDGFFKGSPCGKASLLVKNFKPEMQGNYTCQVFLDNSGNSPPVVVAYNLVLAELTQPFFPLADPVTSELLVYEDLDNLVECEVFSIPHATISWRLDGKELGKEEYTQEPHLYSHDMVRSVLNLKPDRYLHYKTLECLASNEAVTTVFDQGALGEWVSQPHTTKAYLVVNYPPDDPVIAFNEGEWMAVGDDLDIVCKVRDIGQPIAKLSLELPDGTSIEGSQEDQTAMHFFVESTMIVRANHDGEKVTCYADSPDPLLSRETSKALKVAFGPSGASIEGNRPVNEGDLINLYCSPVGTNPNAVLQWETPDYSNLPEHAQCPVGNICNQLAGRLEVEGNRLSLKADWKDNRGRVTCTAVNEVTYKEAEAFVILDVQHKPVWNGTENERIVGASIGEEVTLRCDVMSNPPPFAYQWRYLGRVMEKQYNPCDWVDRSNVYPCDEEEDCDWKKWEGGSWVPYDDPCGIEVTPTPSPELLNSDLPELTFTMEEDANGEVRFGVYRCSAVNDHGSADFDIEIEDRDYAVSRTRELIVIVAVACLLGVVIVIAVIVVTIVASIRKRRMQRYAVSSSSASEDSYEIGAGDAAKSGGQRFVDADRPTNGNYSVVDGSVSVGSAGDRPDGSYAGDSYGWPSRGNGSVANGSVVNGGVANGSVTHGFPTLV